MLNVSYLVDITYLVCISICNFQLLCIAPVAPKKVERVSNPFTFFRATQKSWPNLAPEKCEKPDKFDYKIATSLDELTRCQNSTLEVRY